MNKKLIIIFALSFCLMLTGFACGHKHSFYGKYQSDEQYHYQVCSCGEKGTKEEHKIVIDEYVAPTCVKNGLTQGSHCSVCGYVIVAQQVIPKSEQYHNIKHFEYKAPTCTTDGHNEYEACTNGCGYSTYQKIEKLGHKYLEWEHMEGTKVHKRICENNENHFELEDCDFEVLEVIDPTCTNQGYSICKCKKCGYICNDHYTSALGHTITLSDKLNYVAPTCETAGGYDIKITCIYCGLELGEEHMPEQPLGHLWGEWEHIEETETHKRVCTRDENHIEIENCNKVFKLDGVSYIKFVCDKCGQDYYEYEQPTGMQETKSLTLILPQTFNVNSQNKRKIK